MPDIATPDMPKIWLLSGDIMGPLGGGFRQQRWCEYYLARGYDIRLFFVSGAWTVAWVDVHSVEELQTKRREWVASAAPRAGVRDSQFARVARLAKHSLLLDFFLPSLLRLIVMLHGMKQRAPGVTVLLCSSPPFTLAFAGRVMKAIWGDRIVMALDMRDLWSLHDAFSGPKIQKRFVERWVIGGSDDFTTVSVGLAQRFNAVFKASPQVVYNVATHVRADIGSASIDWPAFSNSLHKGSFKLIYTGSVPQGFYDLGSFVMSVAAFAREHVEAAKMLQIIFVGAGGEMAAAVAKVTLPTDLFVFLPQMTHEDVSRIQAAADALLFLGYRASDNQGQVSIKLFEYFRRGRPILPVFIKPSSDVDYLIDLYCGSCPHFNSVDDVASVLLKLSAEGPASLPRTINLGADNTLLNEYERAVDRIVAKASL